MMTQSIVFLMIANVLTVSSASFVALLAYSYNTSDRVSTSTASVSDAVHAAAGNQTLLAPDAMSALYTVSLMGFSAPGSLPHPVR